MRDENLVKKGLIIFEGPPKTGKYVITRKGEEFLASLMKEGDHQ
jgi:predicted transcriptional regulator